MEGMDLGTKLMFGLGFLIGAYTLIYGMLIWLGYFADRPPTPPAPDDDATGAPDRRS